MNRSITKVIIVGLIGIILISSCAYEVLFWERNIWQDFHGIFTIAETSNVELYRQLLHKQFSIPDHPMVGIFVIDYMDTERWPITPTKILGPYLEASIFLRCNYNNQTGWYCLLCP